MKTYKAIFAIALQACSASQAADLPNQSTVIWDQGNFQIVDHHRLPQPKIEQIAKGIHIDPRLLRELKATGKKKDL